MSNGEPEAKKAGGVPSTVMGSCWKGGTGGTVWIFVERQFWVISMIYKSCLLSFAC